MGRLSLHRAPLAALVGDPGGARRLSAEMSLWRGLPGSGLSAASLSPDKA